MAKQAGTYGFRGKLGEVVGRRINGQLVVGKPGGFTKETWKKNAQNPDFAPRKEAGEFAASSSMAKAVYRICDADMATSHCDPRAYKRLVSHFQNFRILDRSNPKGKKRPGPGAFHHLVDFNLNMKSRLFDLILPSPDFRDNDLVFDISDIHLPKSLPEEVNALEFIGFSAEVDFKSLTCINRVSTYLLKSFDELSAPFEFIIPGQTQNALFLAAIRCYIVHADYPYPLSDRALSPMKIVAFKA
jgi:hypothetical protein